MLVACWSAKGGVGTTVVAAALALQLAHDVVSGAAPGAPRGAATAATPGSARLTTSRATPGARGAATPGTGRAGAPDTATAGAARTAMPGTASAATPGTVRPTVPGVVLADLAGDAPAVLGLPEPASPGLAGWLAAGDDVPADALARLEVEVAPGLHLLPRGRDPLQPGRAAVLAALLDRSPRVAVVDCGRAGEAAADAVIALARPSLLVTRRCYMALRRAAHAPLRPTGVVVVNEPGRVLSTGDVSDIVKAPVVAEVEIDPAVARQVDAGLLAGRLPRSLQPLRGAA